MSAYRLGGDHAARQLCADLCYDDLQALAAVRSAADDVLQIFRTVADPCLCCMQMRIRNVFAFHDFTDHKFGALCHRFNAFNFQAGSCHSFSQFFRCDTGEIHVFTKPFITQSHISFPPQSKRSKFFRNLRSFV